MMGRGGRGWPAAILVLVVASACSADPTPEPTPEPTTFPAAGPDDAAAVADAFVSAWASGDYEAMYATLDRGERHRVPREPFTELYAAFADMTRADRITATVGTPATIGLPPEPPPPATPVPTASAAPMPDPSAAVDPSATLAPSEPPFDPDQPLDGPVPAISVPLEISIESDRFGDVAMDRSLTLVQGEDGWLVRWSPELLFPELGPDGRLRLDREVGSRGRIVGPGNVVWAQNREDGARVYPQEALAGQVIGYVGEVTAEDLETLEAEGYRAGDVVGRSGLESGAEALLRGTPGWSLVAVPARGDPTVVLETEMVPGADVAITIRPEIQAAAQDSLSAYGQGATAVVDPRSGDVWALASQPAFNPNSMTIGSTLGGIALSPAGEAQIFDKAVLAAYPAGSSFKPFTLIAALDTGVVTPSSTRPCPPTWQYGDFTFHNYMDHTLPGSVGLAESMAFSCNTTYMPLAFEVYQVDETALTDLLKEFGFGAPTGIGYLIEESGIVPDDEWLRENGRGGYSGFEQVQLAIGQGAFLGTPLQLANAFAAIGNGGRLWTPRIVTTATLPDGTVVERVDAAAANDIPVDPADLAFVTDTLQAVVTLPYGTGTAAFAGFGIPVAGKSGTAESGGPDPHAWFPAYAPADDPTIAVATVLPNIPLGTGGSDAAPLVRRVMAVHFSN
jgi:hypothetical protein